MSCTASSATTTTTTTTSARTQHQLMRAMATRLPHKLASRSCTISHLLRSLAHQWLPRRTISHQLRLLRKMTPSTTTTTKKHSSRRRWCTTSQRRKCRQPRRTSSLRPSQHCQCRRVGRRLPSHCLPYHRSSTALPHRRRGDEREQDEQDDDDGDNELVSRTRANCDKPSRG